MVAPGFYGWGKRRGRRVRAGCQLLLAPGWRRPAAVEGTPFLIRMPPGIRPLRAACGSLSPGVPALRFFSRLGFSACAAFSRKFSLALASPAMRRRRRHRKTNIGGGKGSPFSLGLSRRTNTFWVVGRCKGRDNGLWENGGRWRGLCPGSGWWAERRHLVELAKRSGASTQRHRKRGGTMGLARSASLSDHAHRWSFELPWRKKGRPIDFRASLAVETHIASALKLGRGGQCRCRSGKWGRHGRCPWVGGWMGGAAAHLVELAKRSGASIKAARSLSRACPALVAPLARVGGGGPGRRGAGGATSTHNAR